MAMTLIVLAATMGNKYGGLKQLEGIGPNGETILDFSIYDAVRVGFDKIVFVISRHFEQEFKKLVLSLKTASSLSQNLISDIRP